MSFIAKIWYICHDVLQGFKFSNTCTNASPDDNKAAFFSLFFFLCSNTYYLFYNGSRAFIQICCFKYHVMAHMKVSTQQKADKAMLTVCHRFLCTQSHLYYNYHCIVKSTVCPLLLFTVKKPFAFSTSHFTYLPSRLPLQLVFGMFSSRQWQTKCHDFYMSLPLPHLNNRSLFLNDSCQPFYSHFYPDKIRL